MNVVNNSNSIPHFTQPQKAVLPLTVLIPIIVGWVVWKWFKKKRGAGGRGDDTIHRMALLDTGVCGLLFGQFLFHVVPRVALTEYGNSGVNTYAINLLYILIGFLPMVWLQKLWKVMAVNPNHDFRDTPHSVEIIDLLDVDNGVSDFTVMSPDQVSTVEPGRYEARQEVKRRRLYVAIVYVIIFFQSVLDGVWMVYNQYEQDPRALVAVFYIDKLCESLIQASILTYALAPQRWYWLLICGFAFVGVGVSTIFPLLPFLDAQFVASTVEHVALRFFLGLSGGILLWISVYLLFLDAVRRSERGKAIGLLFVFTVSILVSWATGYFM